MEKFIEKKTKVLDDIVCDICEKSCKMDYESVEFARINAQWGYFSKKDESNYKIDLCENCFDKTIEFLEKLKKGKISPIGN